MEVSLAVLADYANVSQEGKLNILGIFNNVFVRSFPGKLVQCFLVVKLIADVQEKGTRHQVQFKLADPDGKLLADHRMELEVPADGPPGPPEINLIALAADLLVFYRQGPHELEVCLDGAERRTIRVSVTQIDASAG